MKNDKNRQLHERIGRLVADAITRIESGEQVMLQIDVANSGVSISDSTHVISEKREYAFQPIEPEAAPAAGGIAAKIDQDATTLADDRDRIKEIADVLLNGGKVEAIHGEALLGANIFNDIACAAASHGMTGTLSVYFTSDDKNAVEPDPNQP